MKFAACGDNGRRDAEVCRGSRVDDAYVFAGGGGCGVDGVEGYVRKAVDVGGGVGEGGGHYGWLDGWGSCGSWETDGIELGCKKGCWGKGCLRRRCKMSQSLMRSLSSFG